MKTKIAAFKLNRLAITRTTGNPKEYAHAVSLEYSTYDVSKSLILRIHDTPGQWFLGTLFEKPSVDGQTDIAIDYGQGWYCINFDHVMAEVKALIAKGDINGKTFEAISGKRAQMFLDYFNNFLTVDRFAEYYGLTKDEAQEVIDLGRAEHESQFNKGAANA